MRNGSGTYVLPAGQPVVTGTTISSTVHNTLANDLANALTTSIATDGQSVVTANIPFSGYKLMGIGAATVAGDAARYEQIGALALIQGVAASGANSDITSLSGLTTGLALPAVSGLTGVNNAAAAATKFDLDARSVCLKNSTNGTVVRGSTGTITCDLGLAGPAANGRDQAAAFTASSWVYLYFIWNGTTLATLASPIAPASFTGSTLPSGYTHWAFATAVYWNGSSNIVPALVRGASVYYQTRVTAVGSGVATVQTAIDLSSIVPPNALRIIGSGHLFNNSAGVGFYNSYIRFFQGINAIGLAIGVNGAAQAAGDSQGFNLPNYEQTLYYINDTGNTGLSVFINGYVVANGDS